MSVHTPLGNRPTINTLPGPEWLHTGQVAGHEIDDVLITGHSTVSTDMQAKTVNEHARQWPMTGVPQAGQHACP